MGLRLADEDAAPDARPTLGEALRLEEPHGGMHGAGTDAVLPGQLGLRPQTAAGWQAAIDDHRAKATRQHLHQGDLVEGIRGRRASRIGAPSIRSAWAPRALRDRCGGAPCTCH